MLYVFLIQLPTLFVIYFTVDIIKLIIMCRTVGYEFFQELKIILRF